MTFRLPGDIELGDMTDFDALELQLLEIIIPAGSEGRNFGMPDLYNEVVRGNSGVKKIAMNLAIEKIVAALVDLVAERCIRIRHYVGKESWRREGSETTEQFHRGTFTCTREFPAAFKRQSALLGQSKRGIFISHNVPESKLPIAFKKFLRSALEGDYPVFVSSDFQTIQTGKPWFAEIVTAVQTSTAVLVIVTPESVDQRWLNFEAGIGIGCGIPVMPLLTRGFTKALFKPPLNQLQARDLANKADFAGMIADFKEVFSCNWTAEATNALFAEVQEICVELDTGAPKAT
jgi:TIR domain